MAALTIVVPDEDATRILQRFCQAGGWVNLATSGTRINFAKQMIANYLIALVDNVERTEAEAAAYALIVIPETIVTFE